MTVSEPLVSVVTPVYNGEAYLAECIESVLAQTYRNWEYTIVNNRSTDRTLEIAMKYADRYPRIRIHNNTEFLDIIANHNLAVRQISPQSKYCKVIFSDDWMFPDCLEKMVALAERRPSVGIVGAYAFDGAKVFLQGLPYGPEVFDGRQICRQTLLDRLYVFGTPTSLLMRSDLVRSRPMLYNEANFHADLETCYELLRDSDFGFVHQVLTYSREREQSNSGRAKSLDSLALGHLAVVLKYGKIYLSEQENRLRVERKLNEYYRVLAKNLFRLRTEEFWNFHQGRLAGMGFEIGKSRLLGGLLREIFWAAAHPLNSLDGLWHWWGAALRRGSPAPAPHGRKHRVAAQ